MAKTKRQAVKEIRDFFIWVADCISEDDECIEMYIEGDLTLRDLLEAAHAAVEEEDERCS